MFRKNIQQAVAVILTRKGDGQKSKWVYRLGGGKWRVEHLLKVRERVAG